MKYEDPTLTEEKKAQVMTWFENICNPEFSLIDGLIQMFIDQVEDPSITLKILKVLRKLNEHLPETVGDQFFSNLKFPEAVVKYLELTPLEQIVGDAFILFINKSSIVDFSKKIYHSYSYKYPAPPGPSAKNVY